MWFIPTKKEVEREFKKIKSSFENRDIKLNQALKERDDKIEKLREKIESNSLKIATIEGAYLLSNKSQSQHSLIKSQAVSGQGLETKIIKRIKQNKKSLIMAEIMKLTPSYTTSEIFQVIVKDKNLCSKASFYRYLDSLKSQKLVSNEAKLRQN